MGHCSKSESIDDLSINSYRILMPMCFGILILLSFFSFENSIYSFLLVYSVLNPKKYSK